MKLPRQRLAFLFWITLMNALGCGPFFPDTVLDLPQAALRVRSSCLLDEMIAIDRSHGRGLSLRPAGLAMIQRSNKSHDWRMSYEQLISKQLRQSVESIIAPDMPEELAMSTSFGEGATQTEALELAEVLLENKVAPPRVLEIIKTFVSWRTSMPQVDVNGPWNIAVPPQAKISEPPNFSEVPRDILDYWKAAHAWRGGDLPSARAAWQAILELPETDHRHRAVWAAWMLAKTSSDQAAAVPFYQKTVALADDGCRDALGLSSLAMGWLAKVETDPVAKLKGYFEAACAGHEDMLVSLSWQDDPILADEQAMSRAATDPLAREILTALLFAGSPELPEKRKDVRSDSWLALLEKHPTGKPSPSAAKAAWMCYSRADFEAARRWLAQAPPDAGEVLWLKAKLALRDGKLNEAARLFAKAAPIYQFAPKEEPPAPMLYEMQRHDYPGRRDWMSGQFHADRAIVHIGRGEFLRAMGFLVKASYHDDAAYLAERVLTTDELVSWVKQNRPAPAEDPAAPIFLNGADGRPHAPDAIWIQDPLRYVLARRLAREFRFREAAEFMPAALKPLFNHYVRLHRAQSDSWPRETKAAIMWDLARMRRRLGMEFFGYEGAPDNTSWDGNFPATNLVGRRLCKTGWHAGWDDHDHMLIRESTDGANRAIPPISREELQRLAKHRANSEQRFHYRYDAAEIAWDAAVLLPDNDPRTLYILHEAGRWLANRDPLAADRFYQEIIRRCLGLPQGRELDRRRWFLPQAPDAVLPELPAGLRFSEADVAANWRATSKDSP